MKDCVIFVLNNLHEKGFSAKYVDPFLIFVCWNIPKPNLRITDIPKLTNAVPSKPSTPMIEYRPIENFQGNGNYLYHQPASTSSSTTTTKYRALPPSQETYRETSTFNRMMAAAPTFSRPQYTTPQQPVQQEHSPANRNMLFSSFSNRPSIHLPRQF